MIKLKRSFYKRETIRVSREILGKVLVHDSQKGTTSGKIVEVEAYLGPHDPASHAYKNRKTKRTIIQYGSRGYAYIYQIYGRYFCFNIVTGERNKPEVILIRALEPVNGIELMIKRRGLKERNRTNITHLMNGPAKLCQAMGIDKSLYGEDLCGTSFYIIDDGTELNPEDIIATPRINIEYAGKAKGYLRRFIIKNSSFISKK